MKRIFLLLILNSLFSFNLAFAQGIIVHLKDGSEKAFLSKNIDKISVYDESENYKLRGTWYLGVLKNGATVMHWDGIENITFYDDHAVWAGTQEGDKIYDIKYLNEKTIRATLRSGDEISTWNIVQNEEDVIAIDDGFWTRYFYPTSQEAVDAQVELAPPSHTETSNINTILSYAGGHTYSSITPMGTHFEGARKATESDLAWLKNPEKEPDFEGGLTQWIAKTVTLYPFGEPLPADVNQHSIGDCSACSVFASFAYLFPDFIKHIITDNGNNTYTVKMYDPEGKQIEVCVSNKVQCDNNGTVGQVTGKNYAVTWATILEKAMMKWEKIYQVDNVEGIGTEFASPLFTGEGDSFSFGPNDLYTSELKTIIEWALGEGRVCIGGFNVGGLKCGQLESVMYHAFAFMLSNESSSVFAMRNPWGIEEVDGLLEIPYDRTIVQAIDARIVKPGAAADYLKKPLLPYTPPIVNSNARMTLKDVSPRLRNRKVTKENMYKLW